jgi:hypothetical protein
MSLLIRTMWHIGIDYKRRMWIKKFMTYEMIKKNYEKKVKLYYCLKVWVFLVHDYVSFEPFQMN